METAIAIIFIAIFIGIPTVLSIIKAFKGEPTDREVKDGEPIETGRWVEPDYTGTYPFNER